MRLLRPVDGVAGGVRRARGDQCPPLPPPSFPRRQRCENGKGALSRSARRPGAAGFRGLSLCRAAGAGVVVADSVLLRAGVEPSVRPSDLQLDRRESKSALGPAAAKVEPLNWHDAAAPSPAE